MLEGEIGVSPLDKNDPNYDSDEDRAVTMAAREPHNRLREEVAAYKQEITAIVEEYFSSGDVSNAADSLSELGATETMGHYFVKRLITLALDRKDKEREMASSLLSNLYAEVLPGDQVQKGFAKLVESLDDLRLDVPDAVELLSLFIARGVVDDILPPACITKWSSGAPEGSSLAALKARCELHLAARHSAERMLRCWGSGAGQSHAETKERIAKLLEEYLDSLDVSEASRCLRGLSVPFFHHELVKQAIHIGMEQPNQVDNVINLLKKMSDTNEVNTSQLSRGFQRVANNLPDTTLDNPAAHEQFTRVLDAAAAASLLEADAVADLRRAAAGGPAEQRPISAASATSNGLAAAAAAAAAANGVGGAGVPAFKLAMTSALKEYFNSADTSEVAARLLELDEPGLHPLFVKQVVTLAMDRRDREREMASGLLSSLHPQVITPDQMVSGFTRLLASADDLVLDIPDAVHLLSLFLGRAIVDEVLAPAFLANCLPSLPDGGLGITVVQATGAMLSQRHAAERLQTCWHGGGLSLEDVRKQMRDALDEFMVAGSSTEVAAVLQDLGLPHFHHELVKAAVELSFEHPDKSQQFAALLRQLSETGVISSTQLAQGLKRVQDRLADEALDAPAAPAAFAKLLEQAGNEGWLPPEMSAASAGQ
eukprot:GHUV01007086.1.p1 GENE.GHUV01007086.1~~GHUV01007086.1.p1  ORF type:complete len:655 (+),score=257.56 GHUV01007086.1:532-2496(+)